MKSRKLFLAVAATAAIACMAAFTSVVLSTQAAAQANPTMTNVIPDSGSYSAHGTIQAINPGAGTLTIVPASGSPLPLTAASGVSLANLAVGDNVSVHYSRTVAFEVGTPNVAVPKNEPTQTVGQLAKTPGGIGPEATVISGSVVKLNSASSFDVVNINGGGVYTIQVTNPARLALVSTLKVGDSVTVSLGPVVLTSVAKCGLFGWFGC